MPMPAAPLPEMTLRCAGVEPPTVTFETEKQNPMPRTLWAGVGEAAPVASGPMKLPSMTCPDPPADRQPNES